MKEYKMELVKLSKDDFAAEEKLMNEMAAEGWEVVSVTEDMYLKISVHLLITFSREI